MIVRSVLDNPGLLENFDCFNDGRDTLGWLRHLPPSPKRDLAMRVLQQRLDEFWAGFWRRVRSK